jgi:light-regulated signal transduction histidine kinase (bacteriophytochrome)
MDINLGSGPDGIEAAQRLREVADTPVLYLSAYSEDATLRRARETRPYGYLVKPVSERELHATIQMALERRKVERALKESEWRLQTALAEREAAAAEVGRLNAELEHKVAERTDELKATIAELEGFSYTMAHDLRAGVRSVAGMASILLEDYAEAMNHGGRAYLLRLRTAATTLGAMVDGLLQLSRITRSGLLRANVNLSAIAAELAHALREAEPAREVEFVIAPDVYADCDGRLARILLHQLLRNAWKFTSKQPRARIEFGDLGSTNRPLYYVQDDGVGFDMAYGNKLFGTFQRLHSPGEFEGDGIGLATVKRIVERHGGRVDARGEPGKGATISFTLGPGRQA